VDSQQHRLPSAERSRRSAVKAPWTSVRLMSTSMSKRAVFRDGNICANWNDEQSEHDYIKQGVVNLK
jgi:hypothetical protein